MLAQVKSCSIYGIESFLVDVEVDISSGLPDFHIVGLPDVAVKESRERVRAAIKNQSYVFPIRRITVNLARQIFGKRAAFRFAHSSRNFSGNGTDSC